jgi:hypothetical protein
MEMNLEYKVTLQIKTFICLFCALLMLGQQVNAQETDEVVPDPGVLEESTALSLADPFSNFNATFSAYRYGRELGHATLALSKLENNEYRLDYSSSVSLFFLSDKRKETSVFSIQDDQIIPDSYVFIRTGTGSDKHVRVKFDHEKNKIVVNERPNFPLQQQLDNQIYRLDLQAKLAKGETDFSYEVINYRGELKHYELSVIATESLSLPYGNVEAIKVGFVRENSTRQTYAWFSPALNYQLVRLQQFKDGDEQGDIQLSQFSSSAP